MSNRVVESYWQMLEGLDEQAKLELANRLKVSIQKKTVRNLRSARYFVGSWDDSSTAEEIIDEIKQARRFNRTLESL